MPNLQRLAFRSRTVLSALVVGAVLCVVSSARADSKIATVNPVKVLNALAETKDINSAMNSDQQTFQQQVADREQKLKDLQAQRDQLKPDAPQWADLNKQLVAMRADAQSWAQQQQAELARKFRVNAKQVNDKIGVAINEIGKAKGFDLILAEQKPEVAEADIEKMTPQQYMSLLFAQNILYKSDAVDLTQEVIVKLDSDYKKR